MPLFTILSSGRRRHDRGRLHTSSHSTTAFHLARSGCFFL